MKRNILRREVKNNYRGLTELGYNFIKLPMALMSENPPSKLTFLLFMRSDTVAQLFKTYRFCGITKTSMHLVIHIIIMFTALIR